MKKLLYVLLVMLPMALGAQTTSENYVVSKVYKKATTTPVTENDKDKVSTTVQYFDGLGRTKQSIAVQAGNIVKENLVVSLYNIKGELLQTKNLYQGSTICILDTRALYNGEYIVHVTNGKETIAKKIVVLK